MRVAELWRYPVKSLRSERLAVEDFGGRMALDCRVIEPGRIVLGAPVELIETARAVPDED
jgi:hypothetical protein